MPRTVRELETRAHEVFVERNGVDRDREQIEGDSCPRCVEASGEEHRGDRRRVEAEIEESSGTRMVPERAVTILARGCVRLVPHDAQRVRKKSIAPRSCGAWTVGGPPLEAPVSCEASKESTSGLLVRSRVWLLSGKARPGQ